MSIARAENGSRSGGEGSSPSCWGGQGSSFLHNRTESTLPTARRSDPGLGQKERKQLGVG